MPESERLVINDATRLRPGRGVQSERFGPLPIVEADERLSNRNLDQQIRELEQDLQERGEKKRLVDERKKEELDAAGYEAQEAKRLRLIEIKQAKEAYRVIFSEVRTSVRSRDPERDEVKQLIVELDPKVNYVIQLLDNLYRADMADYNKLSQANQTKFYSGGQNKWNNNGLQVNQPLPNNEVEWVRCIGSDESLRTISPGDATTPLREAITNHVGFLYWSIQQIRTLKQFGLERFARFAK